MKRAERKTQLNASACAQFGDRAVMQSKVRSVWGNRVGHGLVAGHSNVRQAVGPTESPAEHRNLRATGPYLRASNHVDPPIILEQWPC